MYYAHNSLLSNQSLGLFMFYLCFVKILNVAMTIPGLHLKWMWQNVKTLLLGTVYLPSKWKSR